MWTHLEKENTCSVEIQEEVIQGKIPMCHCQKNNQDKEKEKEIAHDDLKCAIFDTPPEHFYISRLVKEALPASCITTLSQLSTSAPEKEEEEDPICKITPVYRLIVDLTEGDVSISLNQEMDNVNDDVLICAGVHAREWASQSILLEMIRQMVDQYNNKKHTTISIHRICLWIIPCVNLFGFLSSASSCVSCVKCPREKEGEDQNTIRMTRKACGKRGTDLNRNFPVAWENISPFDNPQHDCFPGTKPGTEPEVACILSFIKARRKTLKLVIDLHNCGDSVMEVPIFATKQEDVMKIAQQINPLLRDTSRFFFDDFKKKPYSGGGTFSDCATFGFGIPAMTIEVGDNRYAFRSGTPEQYKQCSRMATLLRSFLSEFYDRAVQLKETLDQNDPPFSYCCV